MLGNVGVAQPQTGLNQFKQVVGPQWEGKEAEKAAACYRLWLNVGYLGVWSRLGTPATTTIFYKVFREFDMFLAESYPMYPHLLSCCYIVDLQIQYSVIVFILLVVCQTCFNHASAPAALSLSKLWASAGSG